MALGMPVRTIHPAMPARTTADSARDIVVDGIILSDRSGLATYPSGSSFGPRRLRDYEWVWIVDGTVTWTCDGVDHALPAGAIALCRPGMRDRFAWDAQRTTRHGFIHFRIATPPAGLPPPAAWPAVRVPPPGSPLVGVLDHCCALLARRPDGWRQQAAAGLVFALRAFVGGCLDAGPGGTAATHPVVARLLAHLRWRWGPGPLHPVSLAELCRATATSRVHLTRICQRELGLPPAGVVRAMRLHAVAERLAASRAPVQDIAAACGFASPFHLARLFRAAYGCTPTDYRARMQAGELAPVTPLVRVR